MLELVVTDFQICSRVSFSSWTRQVESRLQPQASFATLMRTVATVVDAKLGPAVDHALRVEASKEPVAGGRIMPTRLETVLGLSVESIAHLLRKMPRSRLQSTTITRRLFDQVLVNQRLDPLLRAPLWEVHCQAPSEAAKYTAAVQSLNAKQATVSVREAVISRTLERLLMDSFPNVLARYLPPAV